MDKAPEISGSIEERGMSVGATLRAAREAQGLTVEDVAERIKFSVRQVEALEADDAAHLPEGTFLRGFIRSYARTLHLDESALLGGAQVQTEPKVAEVAQAVGTFPTAESGRRKSVYLLLGALVVALVLLGFVLGHRDTPRPGEVVLEEVNLPDALTASSVVQADAIAASATQAAPVEPVETEAPVQAEAVEPAAKLAEQPVATPKPQAKPQAAPAAAVAAVSAPLLSGKPEVPLEQLKKRPIHIVFNEDAWMEIKDVNGEVLLSRITPAGSEKWIGGGRRAPYQVSIGKASAVRLYYKGREVDLSQHKQAGLVRLVLE